ncbi:MAG: AzlD domain-containing protein [Bacillota bacterium]|nr:AzlD domain-containing protein [Bacillota bacterium]
MKIFLYILVMAVVTYFIRMVPFTLFRKRVKSPFLQKFFEYIPYAVLSAMTIPWIFSGSRCTALSTGVAFAVAVVLAYFERSLLTVAMTACAAAFAVEIIFYFV